MANAERFITPELKEFEEKILTAGERSKALEQELYIRFRLTASKNVAKLQKLAQRVSFVDVFCSLATVAIENRYCKPTVDLSLNCPYLNQDIQSLKEIRLTRVLYQMMWQSMPIVVKFC